MSDNTKLQYWEMPDDDTIYCVKCGSAIKSSWSFCPKCGTRVQSIDFALEAEARKKDLSVKQLKSIQRMERENAEIKKYLAQQRSQQQFSTRATDPYVDQEKKDRDSAGRAKTVLILIVLAFFGIWTISSLGSTGGTSKTSSPATASPTATPAVKTTPTPRPASATNGQMYHRPTYECVCPLTVSVPSGENDYYVYLRYLHPPHESSESRKASSQSPGLQLSDVSFYVKAGRSVTIDVPIGVYKLSYACGKTWYGTRYRFGNGTMFYTSPDLLTFYSDKDYYYGHTIELWLQTNGNFDTEKISESQFPA